MKIVSFIHSVIIATACVIANPLHAQQTAQEDLGEIVQLTPFEVSAAQSTGYQPGNTNSLVGIRQNLKDLPFNVEIFGEEMIREVGAVDLPQVIEFATNAVVTQGTEGMQRETNMRGIASRYTRRNQYVWYNPSDSFSIGRVEVIRGPVSMLYGQSEPGGLVNQQTKQASTHRNFATIDMRMGTYSQLRTTLDANVHAGKYLGVRVAGVHEDSENWRDGVEKNINGGYVNVHINVTRNTKFAFEYEKVHREDTNPADIISYNGLQVNRSGALDNPAIANGMITKENSQTWSGSAKGFVRDWYNFGANFEQQFSKHVALQVGYSYQHQDTSNRTLPGSGVLYAPNRSNAITWDDDWYVRGSRNHSNSLNTVKNLRARLLIDMELGSTTHQLVIGAERRTDYYDQVTYRERVNDGTPASGAVRPDEIFYIRNGGGYIFPEKPTNPASAANARGYVWKPNANVTKNEELTQSGYIALMSQFFERRLQTLVGVRYDDLDKENMVTRTQQFATTQSSLSAGVTYAFTKELSAYAQYGESFKAPGATRTDPLGRSLNPAIGDGAEVGLKYDIWQDKISGVLTFYQMNLDDDEFNLGADTALRNAVDPSGLNGRNGGNFVDYDTKARGIELQFTLNLSRSLTINVGYGYVDAKTQSDVVYPRLWNDGYMADTSGNPVDAAGNPLMRGGVPVTKADIQMDAVGNITNAAALGLIGNGITGATTNQVTGQPTGTLTLMESGEKTSPRPMHNLTIMARYDFRTGALKGFSLGAYARSRFNYISGYTGETLLGTRQMISGEDRIVVGLSIGYKQKCKYFTWSTRVLADNLFNADYYEGTYGVERWGDKRQVSWINSITF